jgi:hypothetical protein
MKMRLSHLELQSTILANLWLITNSVELDVLDWMAERSASTVANSDMSVHGHDRDLANQFLSATSMNSMLVLRKSCC